MLKAWLRLSVLTLFELLHYRGETTMMRNVNTNEARIQSRMQRPGDIHKKVQHNNVAPSMVERKFSMPKENKRLNMLATGGCILPDLLLGSLWRSW